MGNNPHVLVLMPTHNRADCLGNAITSILGQSFEDIELVVYDDGSTEDTLDLMLEYSKHDDRIQYIDGEVNRGPGHARNRLLERARGHYACWQDDDDVSHKKRIELQVEIMDAYDPSFVATGRTSNMAENGGGITTWREIVGPSAMFSIGKARMVKQHEADRLGQDILWCLDMVEKHGAPMLLPFKLYGLDKTRDDRRTRRMRRGELVPPDKVLRNKTALRLYEKGLFWLGADGALLFRHCVPDAHLQKLVERLREEEPRG